MTVTRSPGLSTGLGFTAGGGHKGATDDLDLIVREAAEALSIAYPGMDITIRFNSDRRSGGAWLVTDAVDGFGRNAEIGLGASIVTAERQKSMLDRYGIWPSCEPGIYIHAHIGRRALATPELANESGYYHGPQDNIATALDFVQTHGSLAFLD